MSTADFDRPLGIGAAGHDFLGLTVARHQVVVLGALDKPAQVVAPGAEVELGEIAVGDLE